MSTRNAELSKQMQLATVALFHAIDSVAAGRFPEWQCHELAGSLETVAAGLRGESAPVFESEQAERPDLARRPGIVGGGSIS